MRINDLLILVFLILTCVLGLFLTGLAFYVCVELFFYIVNGLPMSFTLANFLKILKMSTYGGAVGGIGIWLMAYFSQQSPKR